MPMEEKRMQRALLQFRVPDNIPLVIKALKKAGREDLYNLLDGFLEKEESVV